MPGHTVGDILVVMSAGRSITLLAFMLVLACSFADPDEGTSESGGSTTTGDASTSSSSASSNTGSTAGSNTGSTADSNTAGSTTSDTNSTNDASSSAGTSSTTGSTVTTDPATGSGSTADCDGVCEPGSEPYNGIGCTDDCDYSFENVTQYYCYDNCSPIGEAIGGTHCDPEDADLFCKLLTGDPAAKADSWEQVGVITGPGFCCLGWNGGEGQVDLGPIEWLEGVDNLCYQETDMLETYGAAFALTADSVECVIP